MTAKTTPLDPEELHSNPAFTQGVIAPAAQTLYVGGQLGIESVSACGCSYTAVSTATRGRVTRSAAPRNNCSPSKVVYTIRSVAQFSGINQETQAAPFELVFTPGRRNVTGLATKGVGLRRIGVDRGLCADHLRSQRAPGRMGAREPSEGDS